MSDLSKINLNLLLTLNALLRHAHVSQAASALNVTQSAVSASLKQLREIFDDPLFVRGQQSRLYLTPKAEALKAPVRLAIEQLDAVFSANSAFDPKTARREFHIGLSDHLAFVLLPPLIAYLNQHAPKIKIVQHSLNFLDSLQPFEQEGLDFAVGHFADAPGSLLTRKLFVETPVVVAKKSHPLFKKSRVSLSDIASYPQVFVSLESGPQKNFIYDYFLRQGYALDVSLYTPHTLIALRAVCDSACVTHSVERLVKPMAKSLKLDYVFAPYKRDLPEYQANLYWHAKYQNDGGHAWLRKLIFALLN